jgi:ribosome-associated toxin RatA of RatAB toxin-antitoxin module
VPRITVTVVVNAPLDTVYQLAKDVERLPEFDDNLESVRVLEREGGRTVSEWVGVVREFRQTIRWTEEDEWDDERHICRFSQVKGDFDRYEGTWAFSPDGGNRARIDLTLDYEYNVPLIGPLIKNLLHKKTQQAADGIMTALKAMAEGESSS